MTNKEKKLEILRLLDAKCKHHYAQFLITKADEEAHLAGYKQWQREHPDDGVGCFSMNKWNPDGATANRVNAENLYNKWQSLCDYALESLLE
jgi:hypothetical protein